AGRAYVAVDAHQLGDFAPYLYRTVDYGRTWERIDDGIPRSVLSWTHVIREDPRRPGLLYAGTESGLYVSLDDGRRWVSLQSDLPRAPVHWIDLQPHFNDLVVGTYGRGFWILDDITPLQQLTPGILASDAHLFRPRPAYRFLPREDAVDLSDDPAAGENPEYGAILHLWLAEEPGGDARAEIVDPGGTVRRRLETPDLAPGLNRVHWDLREEASSRPKLRTPPLEHGHVEVPEEGWRPLEEAGSVRPLAPPGRYTVRVVLGSDTLERGLEVLKDPSSVGSPATIRAQVEMVREIRRDVDAVVALVDRIEWVRDQLAALGSRLSGG
ncbi:MAG: sialidase, partial [Gemmatimonadetes bacterium]|nr:sialidase [Gemmatimonadota bacterium]NIR77975.1 sialidase [Gemmatimonadota bacterium]NIT87407.1 sialidase [Gemmatimonadota bacterium]NIU30371.1 sialidase [Gemmatimonadota bacterium]NIU35253.1 sialidase [Gemmatimonadota bacterium]